MRNPIKSGYFLFFLGFLLACSTSKPPTTAQNNSLKDEGDIASADTSAQVVDLEPAIATVPTRPVYNPSHRRLNDLLHTKLELQFNWEKEHVLGKAYLEFTPYFYPQDTLVLDAKGFLIHEVALLVGDDKTPLNYRYDNLNLTIELDRQYTKGEKFWVFIDYTARPEEVEGFGSEAIQGEQGIYFINSDGSQDKPQQIWTQGETEFSSCWFPTIDAPNEKSTQEIYLTVQDRFKTLSNGTLVWSKGAGEDLRTDYWKMDQPHSSYLFMLAIGEFAVVEDEWRGKPVQYFVEPEYEQYARDIFGHTPEMLTFFSEKLGVEYPWAKYAQVVVRDFVSGAMENTTATVLMEDLHRDSRALLDEHWDGIIAHELFHHWFGDLVTCESWANLPLNESFANYSEYLWYEYKYGYDSAEYHNIEEMYDYFDEASETPKQLIRYGYADPGDMFDRHSYNKGGWVLHMLRKYVGDEAFFTAINLYLTSNAFKSAEIHDLRLAFEEVTGEDLNWFFNQWFLDDGHPMLEVEHQYSVADSLLTIQVQQVQNLENFPVFKLPLAVDVWIGDKKHRFSIVIDKAQQQFSWKLNGTPQLIIVDGERQLLGQIQHDISAEMLAYQAQNADHFFHRLMGLSRYAEKAPSFEQLLAIAKPFLNDPFWVNRVVALGAFEGYQAEDLQQVSDIILDLAKNDPVPGVRAEALTTFATLTTGQGDPQPYYDALKDSAYSVVGAGISVLVGQGLPDYVLTPTLEPFKYYNDIQVVLPIADFYLEQQVEGNMPWYLEKLKIMQGENKFYFIPYLAEYLMLWPVVERKDGMEALLRVAQNDSNYYVRAAALNAVEMVDVESTFAEEIDKILEEEEDPRFFEFYEGVEVEGSGE